MVELSKKLRAELLKWKERLNRRLPDFISIRWKVGGAFLFSVLTLFVIGIVSIVQLGVLQGEVNTLAKKDMLVVEQAHRLQESLIEMQDGLRGYVITGDSAMIDVSYTPAEQAFQSDSKSLEKLLGTNPTSLSYLSNAVKYTNQWETYSQQLISERNAGQETQVAATEAAGTGSQMTNQAESDLSKLINQNEQTATHQAQLLSTSVFTTRLIIGILVVLGVVLAVAVGTTASLRTPRNLNAVTRILEDIASADGDLRRRIANVHSRDEVERLAHTTNRLLDTISQMVQTVASNSKTVAVSAGELTVSTDETARVVNGIAATAGEFATISEQAMSALGEMNLASQAVKAQGDEVASVVNEVVLAVGDVFSATERGNELVDEAKQAILQIQSMAEQSYHQTQKLEESSRRIGNISDAIRGIANQTNLLALNAAIEAARAGESGRGFAVVAQEVRKLAEQSRTATEQIDQVVKENQVQAVTVLQSMNDGLQSSAQGAQIMAQTALAFAEIQDSVNKVKPSTNRILQSVQEQGMLTHNTISAIQSVSSYMEQVAAGSEENAASTQESLATVEEISTSAHALEHAAAELSKIVAKFQF